MEYKIIGSVSSTRTPIKYYENIVAGDELLLIFKLNHNDTDLNLAVNFGKLEYWQGVIVEKLPKIIELGLKAHNERIERLDYWSENNG
jgi:hypothetical protein